MIRIQIDGVVYNATPEVKYYNNSNIGLVLNEFETNIKIKEVSLGLFGDQVHDDELGIKSNTDEEREIIDILIDNEIISEPHRYLESTKYGEVSVVNLIMEH